MNDADEGASEDDAPGFVLPPTAASPGPVRLTGYVDVGFADAQGNGTSFAAGDDRLPADYGVDPFAPAVNSRGDVASTDAGGRFTNGFLPRSVAIGGRPSFLLNTASLAVQAQPPGAPVLVFSRIHLLPRFGGDGRGDGTTVLLEQAFGRVTPIFGRELLITAGKFDPVFGIEYLDNQSPVRTGITPSLLARYTTGQGVGAKVFYRQQIAPLWSALSLNVAATNAPPFVEALQPADASLTGRPVVSGRFGYELNLPRLQVKLGASGLEGPRNDQHDRGARQTMWGLDARLTCLGLTLGGEYVHVVEESGEVGKQTGAGEAPISSEFHARGFWAQAAYTVLLGGAFKAVTVYGRYERRNARFVGFREVAVARITPGARLELWDSFILKAEYLVNQERAGAPAVRNNVFTSSLVYSW